MPAVNARVVQEPTELLITAYGGDKALFTTCLAPGKASTILTTTGGEGEPTVSDVFERTTRIFEPIKQMLVDLASPVNVA